MSELFFIKLIFILRLSTFGFLRKFRADQQMKIFFLLWVNDLAVTALLGFSSSLCHPGRHNDALGPVASGWDRVVVGSHAPESCGAGWPSNLSSLFSLGPWGFWFFAQRCCDYSMKLFNFSCKYKTEVSLLLNSLPRNKFFNVFLCPFCCFSGLLNFQLHLWG